MGRITNILQRARDTLADPDEERWSDARLIRLLDEAQKYIARKLDLLHGITDIEIVTNQWLYDLPDDLWAITRATFDNTPIPLLSYQDMDARSRNWETDDGNGIEALIYNLRNPQEIRLYPMPNEDFPITEFTVETDYGVVTEFDEADLGDTYGVMTGLDVTAGDTTTFNSVYGVVTDAEEGPQVNIQYIRDPTTIEAETEELEIPPMFDLALKYYVIGHAFLDDLDTENQSRGSVSLQLFEDELSTLRVRNKERDGTRSTQYHTKYRGFV